MINVFILDRIIIKAWLYIIRFVVVIWFNQFRVRKHAADVAFIMSTSKSAGSPCPLFRSSAQTFVNSERKKVYHKKKLMKLVFARYRASSDNYLISFVSSSRLDFYLLCLYTFFCKNVYFFGWGWTFFFCNSNLKRS